MKIQTVDGIKEVKVLKYIKVNFRKIGIHRTYFDGEFVNDCFSASDYKTGRQITYHNSVELVIKDAEYILKENPNYDYSKHELINK